MFASQVTKVVEVGGESYTIRKLSGASLDKAREAKTITQSRNLREMGGDVVQKLFRSEEAVALAESIKENKPEATPDEQRKARYDLYDRLAVLIAGVLRCGDKPLKPRDIEQELDEETTQGLHEAVLDLSLPSLDAGPKG